MNTFARAVIFLLILGTGIAALAFYWTFYRPLPDYEATVDIGRLQQPVDIHRDTWGVPHIHAQTETDLYTALGYVHAQDRLWQMTLSQLAAEGRFAEFLGEELLPHDRLLRTIGFWRTAQRMEAELTEENRAVLEAYAAGVNRYVERNRSALPIEFSLAGMEPIRWTPTHSLALSRLMAWELNIAWKSELTYAWLEEELPDPHYASLFPEHSQYVDTSAAPVGEPFPRADTLASPVDSASAGLIGTRLMPLIALNGEIRSLLGHAGSRPGSNAWAVDSTRTGTGFPLLAGDPHLGLSMPGRWYEVHLNLRGENLSGATLAGAPAVILGQNEHLAWSLTNVMLDDTDFFLEAVHPEDNSRYMVDSLDTTAVYEPFIVQREVIRIKGQNDTLFTRRLTRHGPVISDVYEGPATGGRVVTMQWTGYDPGDELQALLGMGRAQSVGEFRQAVSGFRSPAQNIIYADRQGNIARYTAANVPRRVPPYIALRPGWDPAMDWQGYIPFDELPHEENPASGWVGNANNPVAPDYPQYLSVYWEPWARYNRIRQYLSGDRMMTPELFQAMQTDTRSDYASELVSIILPVLRASEDPRFDPAISYLENWDYSYQPSETAASILDMFRMNLGRNVFEDEMGPDGYASYVAFSGHPARTLLRFLREGSPFFDDTGTPVRETATDMVLASMRETLDSLEQAHGVEPFEWRWEKLHTLTLRPPLFGEAAADPESSAALRLIVRNMLSKGPYPVPGHDMSLNNGEYSWNEPFDMVLGASIRRIIDLSDPSRSLSIMPGGQSGNPISAYFGDQVESWINGQYKYVYQDSSLFRETQVRTMRLQPEQ